MSGSSFRFLHTSDWHLDHPLGGLVEVPERLIPSLLDGPYQGVDRLIDTALQERVDFVVLVGDLIHFPSASPRAVDFLRTQFGRLAEKKIATFWLGGPLEAGHPLPPDFELPQNVHRMSSTRMENIEVHRGKETIAYIVGQSVGDHGFIDLDELRVPVDGRFFVGLWHGDVRDSDHRRMDELGIDYWAFGGRHNARKFDTTIPAYYSGTPQGRLPAEEGPHGGWLVSVDRNEVEMHFIETDAVRYQTERLEFSGLKDVQGVTGRIHARAAQLQQELGGRDHMLVTWEMVDDGPVGRQLRRLEANEQFMDSLRRQRSETTPNVWHAALRSLRGPIPANYFDEDTILGDYLRVIRDLEQSGDKLLDVQTYLPNTPAALQLAESLRLNDAAARRWLLRDVATLGIDLLSGDAP